MSIPPPRPWDDRAAGAAYLDWLAHRAEAESPFFADRWAQARRMAKVDCYLGWLTLPGLELARRGLPAPPLDRAVVDSVLAAIPGPVEKNWTLPVLIWWQGRYASAFTEAERTSLKSVSLATKFWMPDPGEDQDCYFTENHQLIFHVDELCLGGMFPDEVFPVTGRTGAWHRERARRLLARWLDWHATAGFSEFKSYGYSDAILFALLTLREFGGDELLGRRADALIDTVLTGYALHAFHGDLASPQGRSSVKVTWRGDEWMASAVGSVLWGRGEQRWVLSAAAILLACGGYRVPAAIQAIALDGGGREFRERESLDPDEAVSFGIDPARVEDAMYFWGSQQYDHPLTVEASARVMPWPGYYMAARVAAWREQHRLDREAGLPPQTMPDHTALGRAEQYAWRTPEAKLASVLDYHPGQHGHDQQVWLASLGGRAVCFSHHPGGREPFTRPGWWGAGNGVQPRVGQHRQVLVCVHRIHPQQSTLLTTHAYVPRFACDEWLEDAGWVFLRRGDGYLALRSLMPAHWRPADPQVAQEVHRFDAAARERMLALPYEWEAAGHANVFICEVGRRTDHGPFAAFVRAIAAAPVAGDWREVRYGSPTLGEVRFGWTGPLTVAGAEIPLRSGWRLDCPYGRVRFGERRWDLRAGGHRLELDLASGERRET